MHANKKGYIVPLAIGILVVASLGLLFTSWWNNKHKAATPVASTTTKTEPAAPTNQEQVQAKASSASDDQTLDNDSASIGAQLKSLDSTNADVDASMNDKSGV